jgi:hypothetical protein
LKLIQLESCVVLYGVALLGQVPLPVSEHAGQHAFFRFTTAILDAPETRTSLPCDVRQLRPQLGYDLSFHTGYEVDIRLSDLAGNGDILTTVFRVTPNTNTNTPVYFQQKWTVPAISAVADGKATLDGAFRVGPGEYQVDWLIRDQSERICSAHWRVSAHIPRVDSQSATVLAPSSVAPVSSDIEVAQQGYKVNGDRLFTLAIFLHVATQERGASVLSSEEKQTLLDILRSIGRESRIGKFALLAYSLEDSQILYRQDPAAQIDLSALGDALNSESVGTVTLDKLIAEDIGAPLLVALAREEILPQKADALIFLGPNAMQKTELGRDLLTQLVTADRPVFYLSYDPLHVLDFGHDWIGALVKHWRGYRFNIRRPTDLLSAWSKIMSFIEQENTQRLTANR